MRYCIVIILSLWAKIVLASSDSLFAKRTYVTTFTPAPPHIDGLLEDEVWNAVAWASDFVQREPADGEAPTFQTAFKILYDAKNLYIAIRAYDNEPGQIARRMARRDGFDGDFVEVNIDSYFDKRTAFSFTLCASGVINDEAVSNNGENWDSSWDPIWWGKTRIDHLGWTAEMCIPLSQLRFPNSDNMVWGLQVLRYIFRKQERSYWQYIPQNSTGWVHLFGELHGLKGIRPQKQLEIMPYVVGMADRYPSEKNNPFATGKEQQLNVGGDAKIGITSDITLDLTVNPDFGQVEADPSQVNLSAFEVFFQERRPFFVESRNILEYPLSRGPVGGSFNIDNLVYSRRIGKNPSHFPLRKPNEYIRQPHNTRILGAAKLTGKNQKGFSFGLMEAFTEKTFATIDSMGMRRKEAVEPFTNYFVARAQKDYHDGKTVVGGIATAVHRHLDEPHLQFLLKEAYSTGIDFLHHFDNERKYFLSTNIAISHVKGSTEALRLIQTSNRRLFQRPDAHHLSLNPHRTSLTGHGGMIRLGKRGGGNYRYETGVTWRSPSLELNDIGFLRQADVIRHWAQVSYQQLKPNTYFRRIFSNISTKKAWDFSGKNTLQALSSEVSLQFHNLWWAGGGVEGIFKHISNNDLRGGPSIRYPGGLWTWAWVETNFAKKLYGNVGFSIFTPDQHYHRSLSVWSGIRHRLSNALELSFSPNLNWFFHELQYVQTVKTSTNETRYIVASIHQKTISAQIRLNMILRPNLSLQYYGQPFASVGYYDHFKKITNPSSSDYKNRFFTFTPAHVQPCENGELLFDENLDGTIDFKLWNPNFNFSQFRQNFVLRWEYVPGSVFFAVWAINGEAFDFQSRTTFANVAQFAGNTTSDAYQFYPIKAHHTFLVKYTYRFRA